MKNATTQLKTFLASTKHIVKLHLVTITLLSGTILRYNDGVRPITYLGQTYNPLQFTVPGIKQSIGFSVDAMELLFQPSDSDLIGGTAIATLAARNYFRGATALVTRLIAVDWDTMYSTGPVGGVDLFAGRISETADGGETEFTLRIASFAELLDSEVPNESYSASCNNTLFDTKCGLARASYQVSGTVQAGATAGSVPTNLSQAAGYFDLGYIQFTSGQNNNQRRTIRAHAAGGGLSLIPALPFAPAAGDTFLAFPGCDLSQGTCTTKFNNLLRFRGQPYIPAPETSV